MPWHYTTVPEIQGVSPHKVDECTVALARRQNQPAGTIVIKSVVSRALEMAGEFGMDFSQEAVRNWEVGRQGEE